MSAPDTNVNAEITTGEPVDPDAELREAIEDIERGNCLELTPEQLKELVETGELRVLDEWLAESHD